MATIYPRLGDVAGGRYRVGWLVARLVQIAVTLLALGLFVAGLPARYQRLLAVGLGDQSLADVTHGIDPARDQAALARLGVTAHFYAGLTVALEVGLALVFWLIALAVARRKQNSGFSFFVSLALVVMGVTYQPTIDEFVRFHPDWGLVVGIVGSLGFVFALVLFYVFPNGQFVPRGMAPLAVGWIVWLMASAFFPASPISPRTWPPLLAALAWMSCWLSGVVAQVYRYRRVSSQAERQQSKWALYGLTAAAVGTSALQLLSFLVVPSRPPSTLEALVELGTTPMGELFVLLAPLSIGVAIFRYHLWDVDTLINRTLVYVSLTAIIAGLFSAVLGLSQRLFLALTGGTSEVAVVLTTLVVVAVFDPIRTGIRSTVDKRFRDSPDRTTALKAFTEQVRAVTQVIDVGRVTRRMLEEAVTAFEAEGGAVHLTEDGDSRLIHTWGDWQDGRERIRIPLESDGVQVGVVSLGARRGGENYSSRDRETLRSSAEIVAAMVRLVGHAKLSDESRARDRDTSRRLTDSVEAVSGVLPSASVARAGVEFADSAVSENVHVENGDLWLKTQAQNDSVPRA